MLKINLANQSGSCYWQLSYQCSF